VDFGKVRVQTAVRVPARVEKFSTVGKSFNSNVNATTASASPTYKPIWDSLRWMHLHPKRSRQSGFQPFQTLSSPWCNLALRKLCKSIVSPLCSYPSDCLNLPLLLRVPFALLLIPFCSYQSVVEEQICWTTPLSNRLPAGTEAPTALRSTCNSPFFGASLTLYRHRRFTTAVFKV
jgi:hypothetical protein